MAKMELEHAVQITLEAVRQKDAIISVLETQVRTGQEVARLLEGRITELEAELAKRSKRSRS